MIRILVTGSNGQLGKCFQKSASQYTEIRFVFRDSKALDITNTENIESVFKLENFDFCINCAAYTNVEESEKRPQKAFEINAEGARNIALACKLYDVVLIHFSTDYVFDGEKKSPYTITDVPNPINQYGESKYRGEQYIQEILSNYYIIRTSWLYSEYGKNFYKTIIEKSQTHETLYVTDAQTGCPTNANNLAAFILNTVVSGQMKFGIHHFTDGEVMTWYDFANKILTQNNLEKTTTIIRNNNRSFVKRPKNSVLK